MDKNTILVAVIALLAGFIGGFLLANNLNRSEMAAARSQSVAAPSTGNSNNSTSTSKEPVLSAEEIKAKIAEADANPTNFAFQKNLGISLYRYSAIQSDTGILTDSLRILERAHSIDNKDHDVIVSLGNSLFDIGFARKDLQSFEKAREMYAKALAIRPDDADVKTDVGISYFVQDPPDYQKAASELERVTNANPRQDRAMQFLAQVYIKQNKLADAERIVAKIKEINPGNTAIGELTSQIATAKGPSK